jgi:hypothetical protein
MLVNSFRTLVHAQLDTVWKLLLDRIENPQNYLHGVEDVKIVERSAAGIIRELKWEGKAVREKIVPDDAAYSITQEILEHPLYSGSTVIRALPTSVQNPMAPVYIEANVRLERKSFHLEQMVKTEAEMVTDLEKELEALKAKAEKLESRA